MATDTLMDWFLAAMIHDIGKTLIANRTKEGVERGGWWDNHENLTKARVRGLGYSDLFSSEMVAHIRAHDHRLPQADREENALVMADHLQKAMYEFVPPNEPDLEREEPLEDLFRNTFTGANFNPPFYPYYGQPIVWTEERAVTLVGDIIETMRARNKQFTLSDLLALERKILHNPHTSPSIPHNSLAFHQRFTAVCFYFVYKQLGSLHTIFEWEGLDLAVVALKPDPLSLFYRLKDVEAHQTAVKRRLREGLFEKWFQPRIRVDLAQISLDDNPFEFFSGDGVVVVVRDVEEFLGCVQQIIDDERDATDSLRSVEAEIIEFTIRPPEGWSPTNPRFQVPPNKVTVRQETRHLLSKRTAQFERAVTPRCERCNKPLTLDETVAGTCCAACDELIHATETVGIKLDAVGEAAERRGFVFLTLPVPLKKEAERCAADLLDKFKQDTKRFPVDIADTDNGARVLSFIKPTPTGIFEYLQAVMEMREFQEDVLQGAAGVYSLVQFPDLMIWVMAESKYWDFIVSVSKRLENLHLNHSLSGVLCHPRTPFWSLMDRLTTFHKQEGIYARGTFYDLSGGEVMIFSDEEVKAIRDLARTAYSDMAFKAQLNALVALARTASLRELELEIDERDNLHKLRSDFCRELKAALNRMTGDDQKSRDKRALFIKNIVRLAGFGAERRR